MPESVIWLLVADETSAQIFESRHGSSQLLRSIANENKVVAIGAGAAWRDRSGDFAYELMTVLDRAAEAGQCDDIVIIATKGMLAALRRFMPFAVSRRLIAEIVEDPDNGHACRVERVKPVLTVVADDEPSDDEEPRSQPFPWSRAAGNC